MNRREVLKFGAAIGVVGAVGAARADTVAAQKDATGFRLVVDIPDMPCVSAAVRAVQIDPLTIDADIRRRADDVWAVPGDAHAGHATFTAACTLGASKELQLWWQEAAKGKNIRKNISVTLFTSDKSAGRSYLLYDCFPTQWSNVNFDTSSTVQTETLTVNIGRIEFKT